MNWKDFIQNTNWSFFEVVVGIFAIITSVLVAYHIFFRERKKKSLSYEILTDTELISVHEEAKGRLEVIFDGKPVKNASLLIIRIINDGNVPITSSDFEVPLTFNFDEKVEILSAEINESSEMSLKPKLSNTKNQISFDPILLNPKDEFSIKILITDYEKNFDIDTRIVGVKNIREYVKKSPLLLVIPVGTLIYGIFALVVYLSLSDDNQDKQVFLIAALVFLLLFVFFIILYLISPSKYEKVIRFILDSLLPIDFRKF